MDAIDKKLRTAVKSGQLVEAAGLERVNAAEEAGVINGEEAEKLRDFEARVMDIIHVDDFPYDSFRRSKPASKRKPRQGAKKDTEETVD